MKFIFSIGKYDCFKRKPFFFFHRIKHWFHWLKGVDTICPALDCSSQFCKDKILNLYYPLTFIVPTFSLSGR